MKKPEPVYVSEIDVENRSISISGLPKSNVLTREKMVKGAALAATWNFSHHIPTNKTVTFTTMDGEIEIERSDQAIKKEDPHEVCVFGTSFGMAFEAVDDPDGWAISPEGRKYWASHFTDKDGFTSFSLTEEGKEIQKSLNTVKRAKKEDD